MSEKLYTISLKGATANQPWVVINADSAAEVEDALSQLNELNNDGHSLFQVIADANANYQGVANVANPPAATPAPAQAAPQAAAPAAAAPQQQSSYGRRKASAGTGGRGGRSERLAPGVVPEPCPHGERTFRDGNGAKGYWSAYFCPSPKGTPGQCDPLWVDNG